MAIGLDLDQYQLRNRVLLVFSPNPHDARYHKQHAYLDDDEDSLQEWDIVVFGLFEEGPSFAEDRAVSQEDAARTRDDFGIREGEFGVRLIDLDGTQILRSSRPVAVPDLVDAMMEKKE
jgi:hypothetical protein